MNQYTKNISPDYIDRCCASISCLTQWYSRTESGKSWKKREDRWTIEAVDGRFYYNCFDAVPLFRRLGGSETVRYNYCPAGYLPQTVTSISPDGKTKIIRSFS